MAATFIPAASAAPVIMATTTERARPAEHAPRCRVNPCVHHHFESVSVGADAPRFRAGIPASDVGYSSHEASGGAQSLGTARRGTAVPLSTPGVGRGWKGVVCPRGGPHEWEYFHRGNISAGAVTGTAGVCSLLFCWPALFCLPLIYVGTAKGVKVTSDRKCLRCGMVITHEGRMKSPPTGAATD